jgi:filamentous hemagglutinin family protein
MNHHPYRPARPPFALGPLAASLILSFAAGVHAAPQGGVVAAGGAGIVRNGAATTITQTTANAVINWQSFGIAAGEAVQFRQPGTGSVTLNRVLGPDASAIHGSLSANGKVFLVNPNGILFGSGASVNVGGLVASTLDITDADFMAGRLRFGGTSRAGVLNQGTINADGGYVALLGASVANQGVISARLGSVALAAGQAVTLDVLGDSLLEARVDQGAVNALAENGGLIQADGGQVLMTAQAAGDLLATVVNNTGVVRAQTIQSRNGTIKLLGDMQSGTVTLSGTLDASAPNGGDGGFIETSAARVRIEDSARVTTAAVSGRTGTWLIDPEDFIVQAGFGISGAALSAQLVDTDVVITTVAGPGAGAGDIVINEPVVWNGSLGVSLVPTTLTLNALRDVNINREITATKGNLVVCCGRDVNVNAHITTTFGSILLSAGRDVTIVRAPPPAPVLPAVVSALPDKNLTEITTTDGNVAICAARDIILENNFDGAALVTLTRGSIVAGENLANLGVVRGLTLAAGTGGTGPGVAGGTLKISAGTILTVTGPAGLAPVSIVYNPTSYLTPTNYLPFFATGNGAPFTSRMLVFADGGNKTFDGSTLTTLTGLKGAPAGVSLVAAGGSNATFDTAAVGTAKAVSFTGYSLAGADAANFALPVQCCGPLIGRAMTTADIAAGPPPPPPPPPAPAPPPVVVVPVPVAPVPVPVIIVPPPVIVVPEVEVNAEGMPQFASFVVAPVLLRTPTTLLIVPPATVTPMDLVVVQAPVPPPPAPVAVPMAAPVVPASPPVLVPKPYRN